MTNVLDGAWGGRLEGLFSGLRDRLFVKLRNDASDGILKRIL
jgi:hypothetical protein